MVIQHSQFTLLYSVIINGQSLQNPVRGEERFNLSGFLKIIYDPGRSQLKED